MEHTLASREAGISRELQIGKAGEHFVCCDLIMQGHNAFLTDQGLPYDAIVDMGSRIVRVQVRSTTRLTRNKDGTKVYRFQLRRAKRGLRKMEPGTIDVIAFVALDIRVIAYMPVSDMVARTGFLKQTIDFKTRKLHYPGRVYPNGSVRTPAWGRFIEEFGEFRI